MTDSKPSQIAVAVVRSIDQVLIGKRRPGRPLSGYWEFPGGKLREAESPEDAAVRECAEETGLAIRLVGRHLEVMHDYDHGRLHLHFFEAEPLEPDRPPTPPFCWIPIADLARYRFPPANEQVLKLLLGG